MSELSTLNIAFLPGVGPKKAEILKKELKMVSFEDLLYYFPYKYVDRSRIYAIREVNHQMPYIQVRGRLMQLRTTGEGRNQRMSALLTDGTGTIELTWFKGIKYIAEGLHADHEYLVFGKPTLFNAQINIVHPEMERIKDQLPISAGGWQAFYNTTEKMKNGYLNSKTIQKMVYNAFQAYNGKIPETLPFHIVEKQKLMHLHEALVTVHFPANSLILEKARYRLKLEELFYNQLSILRLRNQRTRFFKGFVFEKVGDYFNDFFYKHLPFELTNAQKKVIKEMRRDMGSGKQMNRLLQGDVGSGKTVVSLMTMLLAIDNGFQACLMAPTEILASQHFQTIANLVNQMPLEIAILTGSTKKSEREKILSRLMSGEIKILVGTHALIEDRVVFLNLGLVVVDEQHRFGVEQRARLWKKNLNPPHVLVMTATPIPRTLALTVYGDLDVSVIDELPAGRKPIYTEHFFHNRRNSLNKILRDQIAQGRQVYVVYPLIEESEKLDFKNLEEGFEYMQSAFPEYKTVMVHGKMKPAEKQAAMDLFITHQAHIMVATTVIEVGVNVPNATVMVIESAERFGLSTLHQLRGRVGRGSDQSYCMLLTSHKVSNETRKRIEIMTRTNNGFEIAEADMRLRGPGDMEGTQQSGMAFDFKIANISQDSEILYQARNLANEILDDDPLLEKKENYLLEKQLKQLAQRKLNWSMIS